MPLRLPPKGPSIQLCSTGRQHRLPEDHPSWDTLPFRGTRLPVFAPRHCRKLSPRVPSIMFSLCLMHFEDLQWPEHEVRLPAPVDSVHDRASPGLRCFRLATPRAHLRSPRTMCIPSTRSFPLTSVTLECRPPGPEHSTRAGNGPFRPSFRNPHFPNSSLGEVPLRNPSLWAYLGHLCSYCT